MRRRLILMRHADSAWATMNGSDHSRSLSERGREEAPRIAERLRDMTWTPEHVLSSDSTRTQETWQTMSETLESGIACTFTRALYHADLEALWTESHAIDRGIGTLLALGHNPGWSEALQMLCGLRESMVPASAALLIGQGEGWPEALRGPWELEALFRP